MRLKDYQKEANAKLGGLVVQVIQLLPPGPKPYVVLFTLTGIGFIGLAAMKAGPLPYAALGLLSVLFSGILWLVKRKRS